nr:peptidase S16 [Acidimicrobiia bacterium]
RSLALAAEMGEARAPVDVELADEPGLASLQAAAVAPIGPLDQLALLGTTTAADRIALLIEVLTDQSELLEARLASPG